MHVRRVAAMLLCMGCSRANRTDWEHGACQKCGSEGWCMAVDDGAHALAQRYNELNGHQLDFALSAAMADIATMATADALRVVDERIASAMRDPKVIAAAIMSLPPEGLEIVRVLLDNLADLGR